jgi:TPR repeat protein
MKSAAELHHCDAQELLTQYYEDGAGCAKNVNEAFRWATLSGMGHRLRETRAIL